jgi:hypothetical protein
MTTSDQFYRLMDLLFNVLASYYVLPGLSLLKIILIVIATMFIRFVVDFLLTEADVR